MKCVDETLDLTNGTQLYYCRWGSKSAPLTFVMIHGTPGSHLDFQYLAPLVVNDECNVISFDLPGNGKTSAKAVGGLQRLDANSIAQSVIVALKILSLKKFILLGHSMGGHTTLQVAANPSISNGLLGIVLLNSMGLRPPSWHYPRIYSSFASLIRLYTKCDDESNVLTRWNKSFYVNHLRFPETIPESHFTAAFLRMSSADYSQVAMDVDVLRRRKVSVFIGLAANDRLIEPDIGHELAAELNTNSIKVWANGGHNIPKSQAADIARELSVWYKGI